jgi:hypothetical protein
MSERDPLLADAEAEAQRNQVHVKPSGDALSVFFFLIPLVKRRSEDSGSYRKGMVAFSFFLVVLSFAMQLCLLWVVGQAMVEEKEAWMSELVTVNDVANETHIPLVGVHAEQEACKAKESLCFAAGGMITCAPKTIQLMGRWENIDVDNDGVFTYKEASNPQFREAVKCKYGVDTLVFFEFLIQEITKSETLKKNNLLHKNLTTRHAIHKSYFDWFKGDAILCSYGADDICGNIFDMGIFDAPLKYPGVSRMIYDAHSAATYCRTLLSDDGRCVNMLPSTYRVWRSQQSSQCGTPAFSQFVYNNPRNEEDVVSLAQVDYANEVEYRKTKNWRFFFFLTVILITFLANTMNDLRQAMRFAIWLRFFPYRALPGDPDFTPDSEDATTLKGISEDHRRLCTVMLVAKVIMTILVAFVGVIFLTSGVSYKDLLFDALSLALITQMDQLVYQMMLRSQAKDELENIEGMYVTIPDGHTGAWYMNISPPMRDFFWAAALLAFSMFIVWEDYQTRLRPVRQALSCACLTEGYNCFEAQTYSKEWWNNYWRFVVPQTYAALESFAGKKGFIGGVGF